MLAVQPPYATLILGCDTKDRTLASCVLLWQIAPSCTHCTSVWRGSQRARAAHGLSTPAHSILQPVILLSLISSLHGHLCCSSVTSSCSHRVVHAAMSFVVSSIPEAQRRTVNMQHTMQTTPVPALPALPPAAWPCTPARDGPCQTLPYTPTRAAAPGRRGHAGQHRCLHGAFTQPLLTARAPAQAQAPLVPPRPPVRLQPFAHLLHCARPSLPPCRSWHENLAPPATSGVLAYHI